MPAVSVIIPTYNRAVLVQQAVESVLKQTFRDYELIVVDDGSTDGTDRALERFGGRLRYVYQTNRGPSAARNRGVHEAQGAFIAFLDSDDLWVPQKLARQLTALRDRADRLVCYTDEIWIRRGVRVNPRKKHHKHSGWIFAHSLRLCLVSPSSVLMRREFFDEVGFFDESLPVCEDYDLWLRASSRMPFLFVREPLIIKRGGHPDQLSRRWGLDVYRVRALVKLLESGELSRRQDWLVRHQIVRRCRILEQGFAKRGKHEEAARYRRLAHQMGSEAAGSAGGTV